MSKKADAKGSKTVCNHTVMEGSCQTLVNMAMNLFLAYEMLQGLEAQFVESYEGEAMPEVAQFLQNLPLHINKLSLFYNKMAQYVQTANDSFKSNDQNMTKGMEG